MQWSIWRVVLENLATLEEVETHWSIHDLQEANEVLDYREYVRSMEIEKMRRRK